MLHTFLSLLKTGKYITLYRYTFIKHKYLEHASAGIYTV